MGSLTVFTQVANFLKENQVTFVAVSKTRPNQAILDRYALGHRIFGENRVQELVAKHQDLPKDIQWHQIGHLQTNKVKYIVPFVALIHAGDSLKLLQKINVESGKVDRVQDVLLQVKVAQEETKHGFLPEELEDVSLLTEIAELPNIRVKGIMGMASFTSDQGQVRREMKKLRQVFEQVRDTNIFGDAFGVLSMGMSGDYKIAVEEGSTMVRIGSLVF